MAPMESEPLRPWVASNMLVRVAQRLNSGTRPMPVAEISMKIAPILRFISNSWEPSPWPAVVISSAIGSSLKNQ